MGNRDFGRDDKETIGAVIYAPETTYIGRINSVIIGVVYIFRPRPDGQFGFPAQFQIIFTISGQSDSIDFVIIMSALHKRKHAGTCLKFIQVAFGEFSIKTQDQVFTIPCIETADAPMPDFFRGLTGHEMAQKLQIGPARIGHDDEIVFFQPNVSSG